MTDKEKRESEERLTRIVHEIDSTLTGLKVTSLEALIGSTVFYAHLLSEMESEAHRMRMPFPPELTMTISFLHRFLEVSAVTIDIIQTNEKRVH